MKLPVTPSFSLAGRNALITGAGRGLGMAAAAALAQAGAQTTLLARSKDQIDKVAATLRARGFQTRAVVLDVTDFAATQTWIASQQPFDILINNAGTARNKPALDSSLEDFDAIFELNVKAAWTVACACAQLLLKAGKSGSFINVSSQMGHISWQDRALYSASKFAVEGFTKGMAYEWAKQGIRVNTLCPTFINTELTAKKLADREFADTVLRNIPLGRLGELEDIMGPLVFLASDAAAMITGTALMVDGGWTAH